MVVLLVFVPACGSVEGDRSSDQISAADGETSGAGTAAEQAGSVISWEPFHEEPGVVHEEHGHDARTGNTAKGTSEEGADDPDTTASGEGSSADDTAAGSNGPLIVLDPGHTAQLSGETEQNGPGSTEMKARDTLGTAGAATGLHEYELNLTVCRKLQKEMENRGYQILLTHDTNDLVMGNIERAQVANENHADIYLRVHADGSTSSAAEGAMTISITQENPYHPELYEESYRLSKILIDRYCEVTGRKNRGVWQTDTMSGNNWSEVPCTLIEMGFMTNPEEDEWMASEDGQALIVQGIADGVDDYFAADTD